MRTDPKLLANETFDLLVVGGGIQGAAIAREAVLRGARVALVERTDFAAATSSRSSRLVHGGVRYLEKGHFALLREALHERERLLRLAPHLVRPLPVLMPHFTDSGKAAWKLALGLRLYQALAGRSTLPGPRGLSAAECVTSFPGLRTKGLRKGTLYFDAATDDARLTLAVCLDAARAGAALCNHATVVGVRDGAVVVRDELDGAEVRVRARVLVNATGPYADATRRAFGIAGDDLVRTSRGTHVVLAPRESETSLAAFLPDGRIQFVIPHDGGTLVGTTEVDASPDEGDGVPDADVAYLENALAWLLDPAPRRDAFVRAFLGWRSLPARKGPAGGLNREAHWISESCAAGTLHTIVGGKLTTHRALGERAVTALLGLGGATATRDRALPGGAGPREVLDPLWWRHGSELVAVRALAVGRPELLEAICPHRPLLRAEAVHAIRALGAATFEDLVERRLLHIQGPCQEAPCRAALRALWDDERAALPQR